MSWSLLYQSDYEGHGDTDSGFYLPCVVIVPVIAAGKPCVPLTAAPIAVPISMRAGVWEMAQLVKSLPRLGFFLVAIVKYLGKGNAKEKGLILVYSSRVLQLTLPGKP